MKYRKATQYLFSVLLFITTVYFANCGKISYDVTIPQQSVQESLDKKFPIKKKFAEITEVTLSNPVLTLRENSDRLSIGLDAKLTQPQIGTELTSGRIVFSNGLAFNNSTGEFLMNNVIVDTVAIDMKNLNEKIKSGIKDFISTQLQENLDGATFYRLDPGNKSTPIAKRLISKVYIHDNNIVVTLTLNK
ncbi:MAG: DUF1439 domain-containing protein [Chitinispirillaceae bacterium]|nr:DUF1439 domain-containing protein [Chitinispirillaceae bacterium]